jgi:hypothetical protein
LTFDLGTCAVALAVEVVVLVVVVVVVDDDVVVNYVVDVVHGLCTWDV